MTDDEEIQFFVCERVTWRPTITVPGSVIITASCGHRVWVGVNGQQFLASPQGAAAYVYCTVCQPIEDASINRRSLPGALEEMSDAFGEDVADLVRKAMKREGIDQGL